MPYRVRPGTRRQALEHAGRQLALVGADGGHRRAQPAATIVVRRRCAVRGAEPLEVAERAEQPGERLVVLGAGLPLARQGRAGRTDAVRGEALEELAPAGEHPEVRREELVRAAHQEVGLERGDVDRQVRGRMDRVDVDERLDRVRRLDDAADIGDRAERVRGEPDRHHLRALREQAVQPIEVE